MARLTIEELKKDPCAKGDFERMKIMGLDPNEPWELVCKILEFCDDGYFNEAVKNCKAAEADTNAPKLFDM